MGGRDGHPGARRLTPDFLVELIRVLGARIGIIGGDVMEVATAAERERPDGAARGPPPARDPWAPSRRSPPGSAVCGPAPCARVLGLALVVCSKGEARRDPEPKAPDTKSPVVSARSRWTSRGRHARRRDSNCTARRSLRARSETQAGAECTLTIAWGAGRLPHQHEYPYRYCRVRHRRRRVPRQDGEEQVHQEGDDSVANGGVGPMTVIVPPGERGQGEASPASTR